MAEPSGRQPFRFRFPWMINTAPNPTTRPRTPEPKTAPTQPATAVPVQRTTRILPMPAQLRPQPQPQPPSPPKKTQPPSSKPAPQPGQAASQPEAQPQAADSLPKSPSRTAPQSQAASQPPSPSQNKDPPKTEPQPSSPSKDKSQTLSPSRTAPLQPQTPPRTQSKSTPPSPTPSQSRVKSHPATHSPAPSQPKAASLPATPSRTASKTSSASNTVPQSPTPTVSQRLPGSRVASKPSSPARPASQPATQMSLQPHSSSSGTTSQQPSPSRHVPVSQSPVQASSQPPSPAKSSVSKPKQASINNAAKTEPALTHPLSQDPQPQVPAHQAESPKPQATSAQVTDRKWFSRVLVPESISTPASKLAPPEMLVPPPLKPSVVPEHPTGPNKYLNSAVQTKEIKEEKSQPNSSRKDDKPNTIYDEESKERKRAESSNLAAGSNRQPQGWSSAKSQQKQNHLSKEAQGEDKDIVRESKFSATNLQKNVNASSESHPSSSVSQAQGERANLHKEIKEGIFGFVHKLGSRDSTQVEDGPVSVITLTGENRGATMHLGAELIRKEGSVHINRGYKLNQDDKNEVTTDGESSSKRRKSNDAITEEDSATTAYINSNVQSINNSIMSSSSISERSPGIRWVMRNNHVEPAKSKGKKKSVEAHKADFSATRPQKFTYEPTVRRRCLRGLLLEPSESDPENPDKPRRHGCRYSCEEKEKMQGQW